MPITITRVVPSGKIEPLAGPATTVAPGRLSCTPTVNVTTAVSLPASVGTVMFAGTVTTGGWVSPLLVPARTVTVNDPVATLPTASVAVQVTVVVPIGKVEPEAGRQETFAVGPLSVAVTMKVTTVLLEPKGATATRLAGRFSTGFSRSSTVTVKELVALLPEASVPTTTTVVTPTGKREPEAGEAITVAPGRLSCTPTVKGTNAS